MRYALPLLLLVAGCSLRASSDVAAEIDANTQAIAALEATVTEQTTTISAVGSKISTVTQNFDPWTLRLTAAGLVVVGYWTAKAIWRALEVAWSKAR